MVRLPVSLALLLAISSPAWAQIREESPRSGNGSTFDSIDPNRTDPGIAYERNAPDRYQRRSGSNGASSGERGTFESGPNDPPPPFTPQREGGR